MTSDAEYFAWQRRALSPAQLAQLSRQAERKRSGQVVDEVAFYDLAADPAILPVLYSQRYEYFEAVGERVAARLEPAGTVLDFGCGVGILTTFYAGQFPHVRFVGVDRSSASIVLAQQRAVALGLTNVCFACQDVITQPLGDRFDLAIATHALVQAEQDPGIPSRDWTTFERAQDPRLQQAFENRTGIGPRLDRLCASLMERGRMILFEKTRQLARRVPLQRALAARGLSLEEPPEPVQYRTIEEISDDGPLFVLRKEGERPLAWDESPEPDEGRPFDPSAVSATAHGPEESLYENHWPSAQHARAKLEGCEILQEFTCEEPDGRQLHAELGTVGSLSYMYCANTFDQRQLVIAELQRTSLLLEYFSSLTDLS